MAFTLENGTGVTGANSYISVADATSYHTLMGNYDWVGSNTDMENALVQATAAVELLYGPRYLSQQLNASQALRWPRYAFYDNYLNLITQGSIPQAIKNAVAETALLVLGGLDLYPEASLTNNVKRQKDKVGDLETESEYFRPNAETTFENYRKVELQLYPVITKNTGKASVNFAR